MSEYVIYHLTSDGKTQNYSDAIASYTDLGAFLSAMDQLSNMVCSIRDRYVKEGNLDNLVTLTLFLSSFSIWESAEPLLRPSFRKESLQSGYYIF
mgnify:CR=1 FL=1